MQLASKFNKEIRFLLFFVDIFSKYMCYSFKKIKKYTTIINAFQKILDESNRKPNEIWVKKDIKF